MMTFKTTDNKATQYRQAFQRFANKEKAISEAIRKMPGVKGKATPGCWHYGSNGSEGA